MVERTEAGLPGSPARRRSPSELPEPIPAAAVEPALTAPWLLLLIVACLLIPGNFSLAGTQMSPYRALLLLIFPFFAWRWLRGEAGGPNAVDVLMLLSTAWLGLALTVGHGLASLPRSTILCVEIFGGYLVGRMLIRNTADYRRFFVLLTIGFACLLPFAVIELLTGKNLIRLLFEPIFNIPPRQGNLGQRLGMTRSQTVFEHPILFGLVASIAVANVLYIWRDKFMRSVQLAVFFVFIVFTTISSGPMLSVLVQLGLTLWDRTGWFLRGKWFWLAGGAVLTLPVLTVAAEFHILDFIIQNLMFNPQTADGRLDHPRVRQRRDRPPPRLRHRAERVGAALVQGADRRQLLAQLRHALRPAEPGAARRGAGDQLLADRHAVHAHPSGAGLPDRLPDHPCRSLGHARHRLHLDRNLGLRLDLHWGRRLVLHARYGGALPGDGSAGPARGGRPSRPPLRGGRRRGWPPLPAAIRPTQGPSTQKQAARETTGMFDTYRKLLDLLTPRERRTFYLLLVMIVVMGLFQMLTVASILPLMFVLQHPAIVETNTTLSRIYTGLGFTSPRGFMVALASAVFFLVIFGMVFKAVTAYATYRFSMMRSYTISSRMLSGYLAQPYTWFLDRHSAGLGAAVLGEVQKVVTMALLPAMKFLTGLATSVALITLLLIVRPEVALAAAALIGGVYALLYVGVRRRVNRMGKERHHLNEQRFRVVGEAFGGMKDVKLLGLEGYFVDRFRGPARRVAEFDALEHQPARGAALRDRGRRLRRARGLHPLPVDH